MQSAQPTHGQQDDIPHWRFPPTNGGVKVIQESATTNFRESPLDKFVREVLQNSTDAHDHNAGPVEVTFQEAAYPSDLFGAASLLRHTEAAWLTASEEGQDKLADQYQKAADILNQPAIRCLNIADRNTTGLAGPNWEALIIKAGSNRKGNSPTAGGTHGIGKNAVFNISAAKTAFYYTCFQEGAGRKRHRVEKWMGKAVLAAHDIDGETRQHIGFYRHSDGEAIQGGAIPEPFRMKSAPGQPNTPPSGTTITVLGFEPSTDDWMQEIAKSAAASFFYAIHHDNLIVNIVDIAGNEMRVDRNTLKRVFAEHDRESGYWDHFSRAHAYYKAIRGLEQPDVIALPDPIGGGVAARIMLGEGPSRTAYMNRNGMFITDSREVHKNPFHIRTPQYCPDYAIIVTPDDDPTNEFIRDLENPAHDEVQPNSIIDAARQRRTKQAFQKGRQQMIAMVNARIDKDLSDANLNLHELAGILGDDSATDAGRQQTLQLTTRIRRQNFQTASALTVVSEPTPDPAPPPNPPPDPPPPPGPPKPTPPPTPPGPPKPPKASAIGRVRLATAGARRAVIMFTTAKPSQTVKLQITPSGEMESREDALQITGASEDRSAGVAVHGDTVEIQARQARRYCVRLNTADDIARTALSVRSVG